MSEPLVLVPGIMCDARLWATQLAVISYERPVTIAPVCAGDRIEEMASGLLSMLPSRFALCGHGMGGSIALEVMRRAPDRVIRLALLGTNPLSDTPQDAAGREPRIIAAKAGRFDTVLKNDVLPRYIGAGPQKEAAAGDLQQMALSIGAEIYARQERAMQRRRDQQSTLRKITQPTLILAGEADQVVPLKRQEFLAELIPYSKRVVLPKVGHLSPLEDPEAVTSAIYEWMRQPLVLR